MNERIYMALIAIFLLIAFPARPEIAWLALLAPFAVDFGSGLAVGFRDSIERSERK